MSDTELASIHLIDRPLAFPSLLDIVTIVVHSLLRPVFLYCRMSSAVT